MLVEHIDFHNVASLELAKGVADGVMLHRFPKELREQLGYETHLGGRKVSQTSTGCEVRFVTSAPFLRIYLSAPVRSGKVVVYQGDFFHSEHSLHQGAVHAIMLERYPTLERTNGLQSEAKNHRFSSKVWRIMVSRDYAGDHEFQVAYHGIDSFGYPLRSPNQEETPAIRWLAYGSSITHGSGATIHHNAYIHQAATRIGVDVLNKGLGGSCLCEPEMAEFLTSLEDWDFATLELGVNMRSQFSSEQFYNRADAVVERFLLTNKPIILLGMFPNADDLPAFAGQPMAKTNQEFREALHMIYKKINSPHLYFVEGQQILSHFIELSVDLLHPSDYGHMMMGQRLAEHIKVIDNIF